MRAYEAGISETPSELVFVKEKAPPELKFQERLSALRKGRPQPKLRLHFEAVSRLDLAREAGSSPR